MDSAHINAKVDINNGITNSNNDASQIGRGPGADAHGPSRRERQGEESSTEAPRGADLQLLAVMQTSGDMQRSGSTTHFRTS